MMNNKRIGTDFEREACGMFARAGWWVHFIVPDARGAQPFDIIAVKNGTALAIDCKTCQDGKIRIGRLEDNQIMAFERWLSCGNTMPVVLCKHDNNIYGVPYITLKEKKLVSLGKEFLVDEKDIADGCYGGMRT